MGSAPEQSGSAALVAEWRELRPRVVSAVGRAAGSSRVIGVSDTASVAAADSSSLRHSELNAEPDSDHTLGADAGINVPPAPPEVLLGVSLVVPRDRTSEGAIVQAVAPAWLLFLDELLTNSEAFFDSIRDSWKELVAGGYQRAGWSVTLTPRSCDLGRDIIAERDDIGAIRILDQVKRFSPGHIVDANDVRAIYGVLNLDRRASKALITTTSRFAPRVYAEFADVTPSRLELRDGQELRKWLVKLAASPLRT